jgi:hypothetical protein
MGKLLILCSIFTTVFSRQLVDEFKAWTPWMISSLVAFAVRRLPKDRQERYCEEWQSHVAEIPGEVGKIFTALSFSIAAFRMNSESRNKSRKAAIASGYIRNEIILIALFLSLSLKENRKMRHFCLLFVLGVAILAYRVIAWLGISIQRHAIPLTLEEGVLIAIVCAAALISNRSLGNTSTTMAI